MRSITLFLFFNLVFAGAAQAQAGGLSGHWRGVISHRGAGLQVSIEIARRDDQMQAHLDIPALVYYRQPMGVGPADNSGLVLEFPFGIGVIKVQPRDDQSLAGDRDGFALQLNRYRPAPVVAQEISFGRAGSKLSGTLLLPAGSQPHPVVVLISGSNNANRNKWSYASWAYFYLAHGVGAFIYDRRDDLTPLPDGSTATINDHARDVAAAITQLRHNARVDAQKIGLAGSSRGAWIAMATNQIVADLAFVIVSSAATNTPAEQETISNLTGMAQDGLSAESIAAARAYLRLYFYVAQTGRGWELLEHALQAGEGSDWLQYVDQPRTLGDLRWWRENMNFDTPSYLRGITAPVLALWGGADFITPWTHYQVPLEAALAAAGNRDVTTRVFANADHRLEISFGEDAAGQWHWFGMAPGVLDTIAKFVGRVTGADRSLHLRDSNVVENPGHP